MDDGGGLLPFLAALLEVPDLLLEPGDLCGVDLCLDLLRDFGLLVLLDLLLGPPPLALRLHHICGSAFALCK